MKPNRFVAIGHIVNDTEPYDHVGGGVAYSAVAATRLGLDAYIITKCPHDHPYLKILKQKGITVFVLPNTQTAITSFSNLYNKKGQRTQKAHVVQELITVSDFKYFPQEILNDALILAATVIGEVDIKLFPILACYGKLFVTPQGYFRKIGNGSIVRPSVWSGFENYLSSSQITVLSHEDLPIEEKNKAEMLFKLINSTPMTVVTNGDQKTTIYNNSKITYINAFPLEKDEITDLTGAGDTYATTFIADYINGNDLKHAATVAALYAALKIIGFGGIGIDSIPTKKQFTVFIKNNEKRVQQFLDINQITGSPISYF